MGANLPITLPFIMSSTGIGKKGVTLPVTLPFAFTGEVVKPTRVKIPLTLPMSFNTSERTKLTVHVPTTFEVEFANLYQELKVPLKETVDTKVVKVPLKEFAIDFKGVIIEENVVAKMRKDITVLEDIRSRILFDAEMVNRNLLKVSWYGEEVPSVEVRHKMEVDEGWTSVGVFAWAEKSATFALDNNEHHIMLIGGNNTGESGKCIVGEANYIRVDPTVGVLINEKIYNVNIDFISEIRVEINY